MNSKNYDELVDMLFKTKSITVCEQNKPFWYTSNKIGPYYINTHFLYGDPKKANNLLKIIDQVSKDRENCSAEILNLTLENYDQDPIYKNLIDNMVLYIRENINEVSYEFISGGERRDWFFSLIVAYKLGKPHLTLFKDLSFIVFVPETVKKDIGAKTNLRMLHIADIITEASSYVRAWIPAVKNFGGTITKSLVVVDRMQGGRENLNSNGVESFALVDVDKQLFNKAYESNLIDSNQYELVMDYIKDPYKSMRDFLINNPGFLAESLKSDKKTAMRARYCIDNDLYNLKNTCY